MKKSLFVKISVPVVIILAAVGSYFFIIKPSLSSGDLRSISSEEELYSFYDRSAGRTELEELLFRYATLPFSLFFFDTYSYYIPSYIEDEIIYRGMSADVINDISDVAEAGSEASSAKDFSSTNIQVENVDEADIIKTDGDYTYSISDTDVVIADVKDPSAPKIASRISASDEAVPEDLILSGDTLTVISTETSNSGRLLSFYSRYYNTNNTVVRVFDISDRTNPLLKKSFKLYSPYYTSRRIDNKLYVISSGRLRLDNSSSKTVLHSYEEGYETKTLALDSIKYLKDLKSDSLTLVSTVDLANLDKDIVVEPFLIDISNAYVSENAFYLLDESYSYAGEFKTDWGSLFGLHGIIGYLVDVYNSSTNYSYGYETSIRKFDISENGVNYVAKTSLEGETINQYSLDEKDNHLRIALETSDGSYVAILDESLNLLGKSSRLAKGERMYASRFVGDKAYLVTYKNTDPLFVIDLSTETSPRVLGELKIPGYSVYLHPYDETHLIGIGMDTEEYTEKDENGHVLWTTTRILGMKMALFDISDFSAPKELSKISIGDNTTSSAILSNPKALLFSKEKELLAIPVNNLETEFIIESDSDDISEFAETFSDLTSYYLSEGYLVYNLNLEDGFSEKGTITHENSRLIRGVYINNNLLTISEKTLMINELENLTKLSELNLAETGE